MKNKSDKTSFFSAYLMFSCMGYIHLLTLSSLLDYFFDLKIIPKGLDEFGVVLTAIPILLFYYFIFFFKKPYKDNLKKFESESNIAIVKTIGVFYFILSVALLIIVVKLQAK